MTSMIRGGRITDAADAYRSLNRLDKAIAIFEKLHTEGITYELALRMSDTDWQIVAREAGVTRPSDITCEMALRLFRSLDRTPFLVNMPLGVSA